MLLPDPDPRLQVTLAGAMLAPLALGACVVRVDSNDFRAREEKRFQVTGAPDINLTTFDGPIDVRGWDRDEVFVEVEKRGREKDAVEQIEVVSEQKGNRITLEARQPGGKKYAFGMLTSMSRSAKLIASVPRGSNIVLRTGDGSISIEQVKGRIELRTSDGSITGLDLSGDLLARTDDGGVRLNSVDGRCDVVTGDGSITLDGRFDFVRARTERRLGDGEGAAGQQGPRELEPDDGRRQRDRLPARRLERGPRRGIEFGAHARRSGPAHPYRRRDSKTMLRGTMGEGGGNLRIRTVDGHIFFKRLPFKLRMPDSERTERMERLKSSNASKSSSASNAPSLPNPQRLPNPSKSLRRPKSPRSPKSAEQAPRSRDARSPPERRPSPVRALVSSSAAALPRTASDR